MKKTIFISIMLMAWFTMQSQNSGVCISDDNSVVSPGAMLEVKSETKGFLMPRMTSAQRNAIASPEIGLQIYNLDRKCVEWFAGTTWTSADAAGTIKPFAGSVDKIPEGWLLCNGTEYFKTEKQDLFNAIGFNWGSSANPDKFKIPDLRGMFLRGVNNGRTDEYKDPDVNGRNANGIGNKDDAGSLQQDAFQGHHHFNKYTTETNYDGYGTGGGGWKSNWASTYQDATTTTAFIVNPASDGTHGTPRTSSESRSKNAYVNYIIKY